MIRIAHIVASFDVGGLQKGVVNLINRSDAGRFRHYVLSLVGGLAMAERLERGEVESLGLAPGRRRSAARAISERLRRFGADIVHTRNWPTFVDGWRARRQAGVTAHVHGYHGRDASGARGFGLKRRIVGRLLTRSTDSVVVLTGAMEQEYLRAFGVPRGGLRVIPNGVEPLPGAPRGRGPRDPFRVLAVGRLDPVKDYGSLVRAFARMRNRSPEDRLRIVGCGPERESLRAAARSAGVADALEMPGLLHDVTEEYRDADVFVQSSVYEGMSNTLAEAMAAGLPVIVTGVGGNPDVVGPAGLMYPAGDEQALAAHLSTLREDPALAVELGTAARARVAREFTFERMVGGYQDLYEDLVESRS